MEWTEKLADYKALKEKGELYPTCPRCDGDRYESAVPIEEIDSLRPMAESYPCPLCVLTATIDIDQAIEWIEGKAEYEEG